MPSEVIVTSQAFSPLQASTVHVDTTRHLNFGMTATAAHGQVATWIMLGDCEGVGQTSHYRDEWRETMPIPAGCARAARRVAARLAGRPSRWRRIQPVPRAGRARVKLAPVRGLRKHGIVRSLPEEFLEYQEAFVTSGNAATGGYVLGSNLN